MKKIKLNAEGNKMLLEKLNNVNLTCIISADLHEEMNIHSIDMRGNGVKGLYSYLKGLDEKCTKYIVISDVPVDYCCRCFDKDTINSIYIAKEVLSFENIYCLNGNLVQIEERVLNEFDQFKYEEFYKEYLSLEEYVSECLCDCVYLRKENDKVYIVKEGPNVYEPMKLLVPNVLYAIMSLQRFYGASKYWDRVCTSFYDICRESKNFCIGHGERKDLYVKQQFEYVLYEMIGGFTYPYGKNISK